MNTVMLLNTSTPLSDAASCTTFGAYIYISVAGEIMANPTKLYTHYLSDEKSLMPYMILYI